MMPNRTKTVLQGMIAVGLSFSSQLAGGSPRNPHLVPVGPFFDTQGNHGKQYAEFCEKILFPSSAWSIRYYEVIANPSATMGISVYRQDGGDYYVDVRQSVPELKSVIHDSDYRAPDLQVIYKRIKMVKANRKIPASTALELTKLWLWVLSDVRPAAEEGNSIFFDAPLIILYSRKKDGTVVAGEFPPDHQAVARFRVFKTIIDNLIAASNAVEADRQRLFSEVERMSRKLRES